MYVYILFVIVFQVSSPRTEAAVRSITGRQDFHFQGTGEASLGQEVPKRTQSLHRQHLEQDQAVSSTQGARRKVPQLSLHGQALRGQQLTQGEMRVRKIVDFGF